MQEVTHVHAKMPQQNEEAKVKCPIGVSEGTVWCGR